MEDQNLVAHHSRESTFGRVILRKNIMRSALTLGCEQLFFVRRALDANMIKTALLSSFVVHSAISHDQLCEILNKSFVYIPYRTNIRPPDNMHRDYV